ncbi:MAG: porin family protein [Acidobacteriota bacterium]|nr:porin family protein [Acidobacteriota bacterium]
MRKALLAIIAVFALSFLAMAQDTPKFEVFGGYQYLRFNPGGGIDGINANGWEAALSGNVNRWFGLKADFSGAYQGDLLGSGVSGSMHTYTFGPELSHRMAKGRLFAHALFGGAHLSGGGVSDNAFAMRIGGGGDYNINDKLAWRVVQFDYLPTHFDFGTGDDWQHHFALSTGVVFRFGSK